METRSQWNPDIDNRNSRSFGLYIKYIYLPAWSQAVRRYRMSSIAEQFLRLKLIIKWKRKTPNHDVHFMGCIIMGSRSKCVSGADNIAIDCVIMASACDILGQSACSKLGQVALATVENIGISPVGITVGVLPDGLVWPSARNSTNAASVVCENQRRVTAK